MAFDGTVTRERVRINLLGEFAFELPGGDRIGWRAGKARSLFGLLLVNRGIVVGKEQLREQLWPDIDHPSTSLKVAVHGVRKVLDAHFGADRDFLRVEYRDFGYVMDAGLDVVVDCHELERCTLAAREAAVHGRRESAMELYRQAAALYAGEFFCGESDDWVTEQRHWLRLTALGALDALAESAMDTGDLIEAAAACRRILAVDSANEAAFRRLMLIHARRGELQQAEHWYSLCARRLHEQFELGPDHHTRALRRRVLSGEFTPESRHPVQHGTAGRTLRIVHAGSTNRMGSIA
ncbi:BTAD domain-containing putative transcriptional regulator [Nocardia sp. NBC_00511]|uniref:AfsR/SARP family transcriptional regulator n=1 Tax=Nocardia sp. NBC_00511 TaxID=2903591 RepID=UPI0030DFF790